MPRTFKVERPAMHGDDVRAWQQFLLRQFAYWRVDHPLRVDGVYGVMTRDATATVLHGLGIAREHMAGGVTPELRTKVRNKRLTAEELRRYRELAAWRVALAARYASRHVASPLSKILSSSWGYHPPVHDGVDLICPANAVGYAICDGEITRADNGGWWGKGAPSPEVAAKGDGVVVLRCTINDGPFRPGLNFVYGHAENVQVRAGDKVRAGDPICRAGFANAWHFHFAVNGRSDAKGVGDRDPMTYVRHARA
jgi:murein DD-endopeptidase MepM/ murein hydrolase activator NlpD